MAAVIIAPHTAPVPSPPSGRDHLRPVPDRAPAHPVRLSAGVYRRRRVVAVLVSSIFVGLVVVASTAVVRAGADTESGGGRSEGVALATGSTYIVRPGDTLWGIATRIQPDGDVRALVDALAERTQGVELRPGQAIDLDGLG